MANLKQYSEILGQMRKQQFAPVYLLHGEEPYYIDKISKFVENNAIEEHERDFNLNIFYGRDLSKELLLETLKRFPMMAQRQVVVIREAQDYKGKWSDLESYFENPVASTVFVIDHKYKNADERKKWVKTIKKNGVVFQSSKHYDSQLPEVVTTFVTQRKYRISGPASFMMAEYLGNDLEKIEMEIEKLTISIPLSKEIEREDIEKHIGMSRSFSVFDFVDALAVKDVYRSYRIAQFFAKNDKNNPPIMIVSGVFNHFSRIMMFHGLKSKDMASIQKLPGCRHPFVAKKIMASAQKYPARKTALIIEKLRETDAQLKGVNSANSSPHDLLKEMTYFILN